MSDEIWGKVDIASWSQLPTVGARLATELDVSTGKAVFFIPIGHEYESSSPYKIPLPSPAVISETSEPVFLIQAEKIGNRIAVGYRPVGGGNGICMYEELEILDKPDSRFF